MSEKNCPNKDNLHLFLVGETLAIQRRDEIELHLAGCVDCRRILSSNFEANSNESEVFETPEFLLEQVTALLQKDSPTEIEVKSPTQTSRIPWYKQNYLQIAFATGLLVVAGLFGIYFLQFQQTSSSDNIFRDGSTDQKSIELLSPQHNLEIFTDKIKFSWLKVDQAKNYTFILSDEKGDIVQEIKTEKLNVEASASEIGLKKGKYYFWQIKAKFADGSFLESKMRKFSSNSYQN